MRLILLATLSFASTLPADGKNDAQKAFQGTWTIVDRKRADTREPVSAPTVEFDGDKYRIKAGDKVVEVGTFRLDGAKKHIEVEATEGMDMGMKWHGIYEIDGDTMRAVVGPTDQDRPTKYDNPPEGVRAFVLRREKK